MFVSLYFRKKCFSIPLSRVQGTVSSHIEHNGTIDVSPLMVTMVQGVLLLFLLFIGFLQAV
jgi:hypothetical protein